VVFSGYSGFLHNKTDHHDITEILLTTFPQIPARVLTVKSEFMKRKCRFFYIDRIGDERAIGHNDCFISNTSNMTGSWKHPFLSNLMMYNQNYQIIVGLVGLWCLSPVLTENAKIFLSWGSNVKTAHIDWSFCCVHWHRKFSVRSSIEITCSGERK
jgi:hypothetical protein